MDGCPLFLGVEYAFCSAGTRRQIFIAYVIERRDNTQGRRLSAFTYLPTSIISIYRFTAGAFSKRR